MIEIPFDLPGQDKARLALEQINASLSTTQREVVKLAASSETGKKAFAEMAKSFGEGKLTADQVRQALLSVASQAPKTAAELRALAKEQEKAAREQEKLTREQEKAIAAQREQNNAWNRGERAAGAMAVAFNATREAISSIVETGDRAVHSIAELAGEQQRLERSQQDLGLNFAQAQAAAGRFTAQLDIMQFASYAANRGLRLHQDELNALTRVAAANAQARGQDIGEVFENMVDGVLEGDESLEKLDTRFRAFSGTAHSASERLQALTQFAREITPATDDAASSLQRYEESIRQSQRTAASAFVEELVQLQQVANGTRDVKTATDEWNETLRALAGTAAFVGEVVVRTLSLLVTATADAIAAAHRVGRAAINGARAGVQSIVRGAASGNLDMDTVASDTTTAFTTDMQGAFGNTGRQAEALTNLAGGLVGDLMGGPDQATRTAGAFTLADARRRRQASERDRETRARTGTDTTKVAGPTDPESRVKATKGIEDHNRARGREIDLTERAIQAVRREAQAREEALRSLDRMGDAFERLSRAREDEQDLVTRMRDTEVSRRREELDIRTQEMAATGRENEARRARIEGLRNLIPEYDALLQRNARALAFARENATAENASPEQRLEAVRQVQELEQREYDLRRRVGDTQREIADTHAELSQRGQLREFFQREADAAVQMADTVRNAYQAMGEAFADAFVAWADGSLEADEALASFADSVLKTFAKIAAQQAVFELARGFASLFLAPQEAAAHFGAAALFFAVAGGSAWASQAVMTKDERQKRDQEAGRSGSDSVRAPRGRELRAENDNARGGNVINVYFGGPMYGTGGVRRAAREIGGVLNSGAIQGGVQLAPAVGWG